MTVNFELIEDKVKKAKIKCLELCVNAGVGHVTSAFSCAEIVAALYYRIMNIDPCNPGSPTRDRFIMSKNHGSVITYPILEDLGYVNKGEIDNFLMDGSFFGIHTKTHIPGADFAGGSLGIGLGVACGMAFAAKIDKNDWLTFCLVGDGEIYEGSIWESVMFAGANHLNNLIVIVDRNHMCITDFTDKMLTQNPLREKWESFNWDVRTVNGHSISEICAVLDDVRERTSDKPLCIVAETVKGNGVDFLENNPFMHGVPPKGEKAVRAKKILEEGK